MPMETSDQSTSFILEFDSLGRLAMRAVSGLTRICLYYFSSADEGEDGFLLHPQGGPAAPGIFEALSSLARGKEDAQPLDSRYYSRLVSSVQGGSLGAVCFERIEGPWPEQDRLLLDGVAAIYASALTARGDRRDALMQNCVWDHMMESTHAFVYVTDLKTDEILFMNRSMKQAFGLESPEGQVCWRVLQRGQEARCSFCPVRMLTPDRAYVWEEENSVTGRVYENYDSLMRWRDGRLVHFQHSTDVTEARRLYKAAMTDELTGALSRLAGKEALNRLLDERADKKEPLSICMLDINNLKAVNDRYGHAAGDRLLIQAASVVRRRLQGQEYLMRLSGDEFVAVLPGVSKAGAAARMQLALKDFNGSRPVFFSEEALFCYGVIEVTERASLRDVLARADERMYQQKRALHIHRAQALLDAPKAAGSAAPFQYDTSRLYDALARSTDSYVYVCNMRTGVFRYPPAMVAEFGLPGEIVPNAAAVWGAKVHPHDKRLFLESNQEITDGRADVHCIEYRAKNARGEWVWLRCRGRLERDENEEPVLFAGFITNLGKKNRLDPLTGLYNKFELASDAARALTGGEPRPFAFLMLGIDGMKQINALYDRVFGDEVIRLAAQRLQSLLPPNASVYRMDGDEFAILFHGGNRTDAEQLFFRIHDAFSGQQAFDGKKFFCTLSMGAAFAPADGACYADLARSASYALEHAKRRGKNRIAFYTRSIVADRRRALELTELLRESVEQGFRGFEMVYQPVFSADRELAGAEALARWRCDKYGPVGPDEFIPLLEQSGLILPVGRWLFEDVLRTLSKWEAKAPAFNMGLNLSYVQLEDEGFFAYMLETLDKTKVNSKRVILELTESYLAANMAQVSQRLMEIRRSGVRIAMDDFGTGYSSLGVLKTAPIDIAKIDRSFIKGIQSSAFDNAFLRLVVELCGVLSIETCLEGVETQEELFAVKSMPLNFLQGFLFGRPLPADEFEQKFLSHL